MNESNIRDELKKLDAQRQDLEVESQEIVEELLQRPEGGGQPMGIDSPLVDHEGYPRGDIDLYRTRHLRKRLAEIKTDMKVVMLKIEEQMQNLMISKKPIDEQEKIASESQLRIAPKPKPKFDPITQKWVVKNWDGTVSGIENGHTRSFDRLHDSLNQSVVSKEGSSTMIPIEPIIVSNPTVTVPQPLQIPFAVVDEVAPHSPADDSGLYIGDLIVQFGPVNYHNHRNLSAIAEVVPNIAAMGRELTVVVLRRRRMSVDHDVSHSVETGIRVKKEIKLYPRSWSGRGLLGCHIKALDATDYEEP